MRFFILSIVFLLASYTVQADTIYLMQEHTGGNNAANALQSAGHTVTNASTSTLTDYSGFDQVWDLRFNTNLSGADVTAYSNFLSQGGKLYLLGEHHGFDSSRNNSLINAINTLGGGSLALTGSSSFSGSQAVTTEGSNLLTASSIGYAAARQVTTTQGFLVSESSSGVGSMVAWDFGDITGNNQSRMVASFDINMFETSRFGSSATILAQQLGEFLSAEAPPAVPEPSSLVFLAMGALAFRRFRRK